MSTFIFKTHVDNISHYLLSLEEDNITPAREEDKHEEDSDQSFNFDDVGKYVRREKRGAMKEWYIYVYTRSDLRVSPRNRVRLSFGLAWIDLVEW